MLVRNAIRLLERFTRVTFREGCYHAQVGRVRIVFGDVDGQVTDLYCRFGRSRRYWEPNNMSQAIRYGLQRMTSIPIPGRQLDVLDVLIVHPGRRFEPMAVFWATDHTRTNPGFTSRCDDEKTLEIARLAVEGRIPQGAALDWVQEHGGEVGRFLDQLPSE